MSRVSAAVANCDLIWLGECMHQNACKMMQHSMRQQHVLTCCSFPAAGRSKGWGIVEFETPEEALTAINTLNGVEMGGRTILVREDREDRDVKQVGCVCWVLEERCWVLTTCWVLGGWRGASRLQQQGCRQRAAQLVAACSFGAGEQPGAASCRVSGSCQHAYGPNTTAFIAAAEIHYFADLHMLSHHLFICSTCPPTAVQRGERHHPSCTPPTRAPRASRASRTS